MQRKNKLARDGGLTHEKKKEGKGELLTLRQTMIVEWKNSPPLVMLPTLAKEDGKCEILKKERIEKKEEHMNMKVFDYGLASYILKEKKGFYNYN